MHVPSIISRLMPSIYERGIHPPTTLLFSFLNSNFIPPVEASPPQSLNGSTYITFPSFRFCSSLSITSLLSPLCLHCIFGQFEKSTVYLDFHLSLSTRLKYLSILSAPL